MFKCNVFSGEPVFKFTDAAGSWPAQAGTWNHRAAAVYAAAEEAPDLDTVAPVLSRGLQKVKFVDHRIPDKVWKAFITTHNTFHAGSGQSFQDLLQESVQIEAEWERHVSYLGMQSANPLYKSTYRDFVLDRSNLPITTTFCIIYLCNNKLIYDNP